MLLSCSALACRVVPDKYYTDNDDERISHQVILFSVEMNGNDL